MSGLMLTNYWLLIVWMIPAACIYYYSRKRPVSVFGRTEYRIPFITAFLIAMPYLIWAGFRGNQFGDTYLYRKGFHNAPSTIAELPAYLETQVKDKGYDVISVLFKVIIGDNEILFLLLIAFVQILCMVYVYRKYSRDYLLSLFLFVASTDYLAWMHNGIRQFLVVSIVFASLPLIVRKNYLPVVVLILLLSTIHQTALVFLPFLLIINGKPWNMRTVLFIIAIIIAVIYLDRFVDILVDVMKTTQYKAEVGDFLKDDGVNIFRALFYSVPAMTAFVVRKQIEECGDSLIYTCVNMSVISMGFYIIGIFTSGIMAGRIPIYFSLSNYILYPWMLDELFTPSTARILKRVLIIVYLIFFYYQMHEAWGLI